MKLDSDINIAAVYKQLILPMESQLDVLKKVVKKKRKKIIIGDSNIDESKISHKSNCYMC